MKLDYDVIKMLASIASGEAKGINMKTKDSHYHKGGKNHVYGAHQGQSIIAHLDRTGTGKVTLGSKTTYYENGYETKKPMRPRE